MKRKISLFLSVVLALSMIMGMSMMTYAYEWQPVVIDCGTDDHKCYEHFYVSSIEPFIVLDDSTHTPYVSGWWLVPNGDVYDCRPGNAKRMARDCFPDNSIETGWYYRINDNSQFFKCPPPVVEAEPSSAAHTHNYYWQTIVEPTKDQDGLECEYCVCGASRNIQRISALGFTLTEYATPMVVNAKPGQTVEIDFGELNSFPKSFMEKVAVKTQQSVSFGFHYNWNHVGQEIRIPAGTEVDTDFDWYGPAKMAELYGAN